MKVLLIESDAHLRDGYALYLRLQGWQVVCADWPDADGPLTEAYGAAIVDASVNVADGQPLWQVLALQGQCPVIALAMSSRQEYAVAHAHLPLVTCLVKPFSLARLSDQLQRLHVQRRVA